MRRVPPKVTMLVILAMFTLPLALAWMMHSGAIRYESASTVNLGRLVSPAVPLDWSGVEMITDGTARAGFSGHWVILFAVPPSCDTPCLELVAKLRQVHRAAGKDQARIKIVLLVEPSHSQARTAELLTIDPGFNLVGSASEAFVATLAKAGSPGAGEKGQSTIYLLDPLGNIMMTYEGESSPNRLSKDLKRLLAWSTQDKRS
jgi:cytochrome oxidase Cu insertion factor (SCO1/SenC/PrrC family)